MVWWWVVAFVAAAVVSYSLAPKPPEQRPPAVRDVEVPTAEAGKPIPVVFGTILLKSPNIVWYGDLKYKAIKKKSGGGGKK
jgi:hypothetical protein